MTRARPFFLNASASKSNQCGEVPERDQDWWPRLSQPLDHDVTSPETYDLPPDLLAWGSDGFINLADVDFVRPHFNASRTVSPAATRDRIPSPCRTPSRPDKRTILLDACCRSFLYLSSCAELMTPYNILTFMAHNSPMYSAMLGPSADGTLGAFAGTHPARQRGSVSRAVIPPDWNPCFHPRRLSFPRMRRAVRISQCIRGHSAARSRSSSSLAAYRARVLVNRRMTPQ